MIQLDEALVKQIKQKIAGAKKILLIAHKNPDGDTLGSALAMFWYLQGLAKDVDICSSNKPGEGLLFLPGTDQIIHEIDDSRYDLVFSFDTADPKLSGFQDKHPNIYANKERHVNIDHHSSNFLFAGINLVVTDAASTTQVLFYLFQHFKAIITRDIATCLLTGLYTDTGSFMHQNTTSETLKVGAALMKAGADLASLSLHFFNTKPVNQLRLWGRVLDRAKITDEEVIVSAIMQRDFDELHSNNDQLGGAIEYLKYVPGIKYAQILSEDSREGKVKGSLRTIREDVNVSAIASKFGGGGHVKAAGFSIPGKLEQEVQWKVIGGQGPQQF